jgi:hypothetical protein
MDHLGGHGLWPLGQFCLRATGPMLWWPHRRAPHETGREGRCVRRRRAVVGSAAMVAIVANISVPDIRLSCGLIGWLAGDGGGATGTRWP